jgi:hypothetical protein
MHSTFWASLTAGFTDKPRTHVSRKENTTDGRTAHAITGACHARCVALLTPVVHAVKRLRRSSLLLAALLTGLAR